MNKRKFLNPTFLTITIPSSIIQETNAYTIVEKLFSLELGSPITYLAMIYKWLPMVTVWTLMGLTCMEKQQRPYYRENHTQLGCDCLSRVDLAAGQNKIPGCGDYDISIICSNEPRICNMAIWQYKLLSIKRIRVRNDNRRNICGYVSETFMI